uniref:Uncharacterized protein n=1 Tax=Anguilla anguilla TaxID=7936 RepID=A0A0E9TVK4_ANGAN
MVVLISGMSQQHRLATQAD